MRFYFLITTILASSLVINCTRKEDEAGVQSALYITAPSGGTIYSASSVGTLTTGGGWGLNDPTTNAQLNCFGVLVGGPDLNQMGCYNSAGAEVARVGTFAGLVATGGTLQVTVPKGPARQIILIGMSATAAADCKNLGTLTSAMKANLSAPHIIGSATKDLVGDQEVVTINASITGATKFLGCNGLLGGYTPGAVSAGEIVGTLDTSFNGLGYKQENIVSGDYDKGFAIGVQSTGNILTAGGGGITNYDSILARFTATGTLDTSFNSTGLVVDDIYSGASDEFKAMFVLPDDKILTLSKKYSGSYDSLLVKKYLANGAVDTSFGTSGETMITYTSNVIPAALAVDSGGKVVAVGYSTADLVIARLTPSGALDSSFNGAGKVQVATTAISGVHAVKIQPDNKIIILGDQTDYSTYWKSFLTRYTSSGTIDTSFSGGTVTIDTTAGSVAEIAYDAQLMSDGRIVIAGDDNGDVFVERYLSTGAIDTGFGSGGRLSFDAGGNDKAFSLVLQPNDKIIIGGISDANALFAKVTIQGALDTSFDGDGILHVIGGDSEIQRMKYYNGKIYFTGKSGSTTAVTDTLVGVLQ